MEHLGILMEQREILEDQYVHMTHGDPNDIMTDSFFLTTSLSWVLKRTSMLYQEISMRI